MNNSNASKQIFDWLDENHIEYTMFEHKAVFTVEEAVAATGHIEGVDAKTLLVKTEKSKQLYLVSLVGEKKLDQKRIKELTTERVRFSDADDLERILQVTPGSVSPLGLIFDTDQEIQAYIIDQDILDANLVTWHPNVNTMTLQFPQEQFQKILGLIPHPKINY